MNEINKIVRGTEYHFNCFDLWCTDFGDQRKSKIKPNKYSSLILMYGFKQTTDGWRKQKRRRKKYTTLLVAEHWFGMLHWKCASCLNWQLCSNDNINLLSTFNSLVAILFALRFVFFSRAVFFLFVFGFFFNILSILPTIVVLLLKRFFFLIFVQRLAINWWQQQNRFLTYMSSFLMLSLWKKSFTFKSAFAMRCNAFLVADNAPFEI